MPSSMIRGPAIITPQPVQAQTFDFYISPTGSDTNPGTLASPWAITTLRNNSPNFATIAGKRVGLLDGTYNVSAFGAQPAGHNDAVRLKVPSGPDAAHPTVIQSVNPRMAVITAKSAGPFGTYNYTTDGAVPIIGAYNTSEVFQYIQLVNLTVAGNLADLIYFHAYQASQGIVIRGCHAYDMANWTGGYVNEGGIHIEGPITGTLISNCNIHDIYDVYAPHTQHINADCIYDYCKDTIIEYCTLWNSGSACYQKVVSAVNPPQGQTFRYNYVYTTATSAWHYDGGVGYTTGSAVTISGTTATISGTVTGHIDIGAQITGAGIAPGTTLTGQTGGTTGGAGTYTVSISQTVSPAVAWGTIDAASAYNYTGRMNGAFAGYTNSLGTPSYMPYHAWNCFGNVFENVAFGDMTNAEVMTLPPISVSHPSGSTTGPQIGDTSADLITNWNYQTLAVDGTKNNGWQWPSSGPEVTFYIPGSSTTASAFDSQPVTFTNGSTTITWATPCTAAHSNTIAIRWGGYGLKADASVYNNTFRLIDYTLAVSTAGLIGPLIPVDPALTGVWVYNNILDNGYVIANNCPGGQACYGGGNNPPQIGAQGANWWRVIDFNNYNFQFAAGSIYSGVRLNYATTDFYTSRTVSFSTSLAAWSAASTTYGPTADANSIQATPSYLVASPTVGGGAAQYKLNAGTPGSAASANPGRVGGVIGGAATDMGAWGLTDVNTGQPLAQIGSNF